ncbi:MAG: transporter substrate-binding domain-containing protein [Betaproteobacteria bacterium]|nr:MAG: transporter substrate-binding domain-containing protein [Betaproteobacteria bacterium]
MGCCEATNPNLEGVVSEAADLKWDRRTALKSLVGMAGIIAVSAGGPRVSAAATKLRLAFCGQLLCVVPYEVTRARGHFAAEDLDVALVYTRGGNAAMQALVGGAVEYAGTSFDVALQAFANGAPIRRFASTGRLPLFALAGSPKRAGEIKSVKDLQGKTVGISALGNADHALLQFLLERAGADPKKVRYAAIGTNVFDALRLGHVDAAMVQEPALTLTVQAGGRELVNFMEIEQARKHLGGAYEFMGVSVRAKERDQRLAEMRRLAAALKKGLADTKFISPDEVIGALPKALVAGGDTAQLKSIIARYRDSLYPDTVSIDVAAAERVLKSQEVAQVMPPGKVDLKALLDTAALGA